jgi:hypothetical protein
MNLENIIFSQFCKKTPLISLHTHTVSNASSTRLSVSCATQCYVQIQDTEVRVIDFYCRKEIIKKILCIHVTIPRRVKKSCISIIKYNQNPASLLKISLKSCKFKKMCLLCHVWSCEELQNPARQTPKTLRDLESYHIYACLILHYWSS